MDQETDNPLSYQPRTPPVKWVTVATFGEPARAGLARQQLEAEEIPCFLDNENIGLLWTLQPAIGGIKLKVPAEYAEQAREVLEEAQNPENQLTDHDLKDWPEDPAPAAVHVVCPHCRSTDTEPLSWGYRMMQTLVIVLLAGMLAFVHFWILLGLAGYTVYFLLMKPDYRCLSCRHRWNA